MFRITLFFLFITNTVTHASKNIPSYDVAIIGGGPAVSLYLFNTVHIRRLYQFKSNFIFSYLSFSLTYFDPIVRDSHVVRYISRRMIRHDSSLYRFSLIGSCRSGYEYYLLALVVASLCR
jgi:hypothetical protein